MTPPAVDAEPDPRRLVLFTHGPNANRIEEATARKLRSQHIATTQRADRDGRLLPVAGVAFAFERIEAALRARTVATADHSEPVTWDAVSCRPVSLDRSSNVRG